ALAVAHGTLLPLTNASPYIGPWNTYLTAAAFLVFGSSLAVARGLVLVLGALTVVSTYALSRALGGSRPTALLAGALLATSGAHVLAGSRVAWSNSTTALYTTVMLLLVVAALRQ